MTLPEFRAKSEFRSRGNQGGRPGDDGTRRGEGVTVATSILTILIAFYAGAVFATGRSWFLVWRGTAGFSALRDVTGIGDRVVLRRLFGLTHPDGFYRVTFAQVLQHRRPAGIILTDLPVHVLFLTTLLWASFGDSPAVAAILWTASAHALVLGVAAISVLASSRPALTD